MAEVSILRKSNEERKQEFVNETKKKIEVEKRFIEEKEKRSGGSLFATEVRV